MAKLRRRRSKSPVLTPSASSNPLLGSDVYEGDDMDWTALKGQLFFLVMRAHYGTAQDKEVVNYWKQAATIGLRRGVYGFLLPSQSVQSQVDAAVAAINAIGGFKAGDMGLYADAENPKAWLNLPATAKLTKRKRAQAHKQIVKAWVKAMPAVETRQQFLLDYLNGVKAATGAMPGLYASPGFLTEVFGDDLSAFAEVPLWIAHWNVKTPSVPDAWQKTMKPPYYQLWQDLGDAWTCPGINGGQKNKADRDWFPGDEAAFNLVFGTPA